MTGLFPRSRWPADRGNGGAPALSRLFPRSPLFPCGFFNSGAGTRRHIARARLSGFPWRW